MRTRLKNLLKLVTWGEYQKLQDEVKKLKTEVAMMKADIKRVDRMATQAIGRPVASTQLYPKRRFL